MDEIKPDSEDFGKGAVPAPQEILDTRYVLSATPQKPIDWETPYNVETGFMAAFVNQKSSSCCTACATLYYCEALQKLENMKDERYSRRFNYSQSHLAGGGAYIHEAMGVPITKGCASLVSVPDGEYLEAELRDKSLNDQAVIEALALKYAQLTNYKNIDALAQIVEDYQGFVTGFQGDGSMISNDGTLNPFPFPISWGHAVWVCGHVTRDHVNRAGTLVHANEKMLKYKNSWGPGWGDSGYGYIPECFVQNGTLFDAYVYAEVKDLDPIGMKFELMKSDMSENVYIVRNGEKTLILEPNVLELIADFSDVKTVTQDELDAIPTKEGRSLAIVIAD